MFENIAFGLRVKNDSVSTLEKMRAVQSSYNKKIKATSDKTEIKDLKRSLKERNYCFKRS